MHSALPARILVLCTALFATQACYTYVPLETDTPPLGETLAARITDQGRVRLAERFGPGLLRIEGRVTQVDSEDVVMNVYRVSQIGTPDARWTGELVRLDREFLGSLELRKLSRGRTWLLAGVATGAIGAFVASQGLFGHFSGDPAEPIDPDPPTESRVWIP